MIKMVCDRCGKATDEVVVKLSYYATKQWRDQYKPSIFFKPTAQRLSDAMEINSVAESYDLCVDCAKKVRAFINELNENDKDDDPFNYIYEEDEVND